MSTRGCVWPIQLATEAAATASGGFMTFEGVEIAHVGLDWPASTGPTTLTFQHLADAARAANEDPHILPPRLKIGHTDPRFNEDPPVHDPFAYHGPLREDGNPVYGRVVNLRLAEDGMVLVGDYVEVPAWLGQALPSAYPNRSLEGDWDIETEGGKHYSFVLTAVALLGEPLPAITCLEDLVRELTGGPAAVLEQAPVTLEKEKPMPSPVAAEASTDSLRAQFFDEFAQGERYWWWPCEIRVDDAWILADDDEGHLFRVPVTVDDNGVATFGDPIPGVLDFREIPDPDRDDEAVAAARGSVHFSSPVAAGRPKDRVRLAAAPTTTGGTTMEDGATGTVSTALLERLGLAEDATEEQALERIAELETAAQAPAQAPVAASASEDDGATVTVSREVWEQTQARLGKLEADTQARAVREAAMRRDLLVDDAVRTGRIAPSERDHYRTMLEVDEAKTGELLSKLAPGRIPVDQRGVAASHEEDAGLDRVLATFGTRRGGRKDS